MKKIWEFIRRKKIYIIIGSIILIILLFCLVRYKKIKEIKSGMILKDAREVEFLSDAYLKDFIVNLDGTILENKKINTEVLGEQKLDFYYLNDKLKIKDSITVNVVDTTKPLIWLNNSMSVRVGSEDNLTDKILCGDIYDNTPKCEIIGEYNLEEVGKYDLVFRATDSSNNIAEKKFTLNVYEPVKGSNKDPKEKVVTEFKDIYQEYKDSDNEIGIDISKWQGDVDFKKLKESGVEFVIIRVGSSKGIDGENFLDPKFIQNIKRANEVWMPVGIYFYSYANTEKRAISDANWIIDQIKDYKVDLPIAFDWENWGTFNNYNLSFFELTNIAISFLDVFKNNGYEGLIYSSKTYLDNIWQATDYPVWLAHYTKKTNYNGNYNFWQLCNNGHVDGILGDVDIDIRYKK